MAYFLKSRRAGTAAPDALSRPSTIKDFVRCANRDVRYEGRSLFLSRTVQGGANKGKLRRDGEPGSPGEGPLSVASLNRRPSNEATRRAADRRRLVDHKSGDGHVQAASTIDPLLEGNPTRRKAPASRSQLPTLGYSWRRPSEIRPQSKRMGSCT